MFVVSKCSPCDQRIPHKPSFGGGLGRGREKLQQHAHQVIPVYAVGSGQFGLDFGVTNLPTWGYEYLKSPIRARYLRMGLPEWQLS